MTAGELTVFLSYLASFFKPVKDLASMNNSIAQTAVAVERIRTILDADAVLPEKPDASEQKIKGEIVFDHVAFAYDASCPVLRDVSFHGQSWPDDWRRWADGRGQIDHHEPDSPVLRSQRGRSSGGRY